jgi:hypothetical protein
MPQLLFSIDCTGIEFGFQISPQKKNREDWSQVSGEARKLELHVRYKSSTQENFWTPPGEIYGRNVVEYRRVEPTYEDAQCRTYLPTIHLDVFEEIRVITVIKSCLINMSVCEVVT